MAPYCCTQGHRLGNNCCLRESQASSPDGYPTMTTAASGWRCRCLVTVRPSDGRANPPCDPRASLLMLPCSSPIETQEGALVVAGRRRGERLIRSGADQWEVMRNRSLESLAMQTQAGAWGKATRANRTIVLTRRAINQIRPPVPLQTPGKTRPSPTRLCTETNRTVLWSSSPSAAWRMRS